MLTTVYLVSPYRVHNLVLQHWLRKDSRAPLPHGVTVNDLPEWDRLSPQMKSVVYPLLQNIEVSTIDNMEGRSQVAVVGMLVRSSWETTTARSEFDKRVGGFLRSWNRQTVNITRSTDVFLCIGDPRLTAVAAPVRALVKFTTIAGRIVHIPSEVQSDGVKKRRVASSEEVQEAAVQALMALLDRPTQRARTPWELLTVKEQLNFMGQILETRHLPMRNALQRLGRFFRALACKYKPPLGYLETHVPPRCHACSGPVHSTRDVQHWRCDGCEQWIHAQCWTGTDCPRCAARGLRPIGRLVPGPMRVPGSCAEQGVWVLPLNRDRLDPGSWVDLVDSEDLNWGEQRAVTETEVISAYPESATIDWTVEEIRQHLLEGGDRTLAPSAAMAGHQPKVLKV